jgi:ABC-type transporter Mla subunit MlaD
MYEKIMASLTVIIEKLENQERLLKWILRKEIASMALIDDLKANVADLITSVAKEDDVIASAVKALNGTTAAIADLQAKLDAAIAAGDPVAVQAASDAIKAQNQLVMDNTAALAAAIPQGTPAAPTIPPA